MFDIIIFSSKIVCIISMIQWIYTILTLTQWKPLYQKYECRHHIPVKANYLTWSGFLIGFTLNSWKDLTKDLNRFYHPKCPQGHTHGLELFQHWLASLVYWTAEHRHCSQTRLYVFIYYVNPISMGGGLAENHAVCPVWSKLNADSIDVHIFI